MGVAPEGPRVSGPMFVRRPRESELPRRESELPRRDSELPRRESDLHRRDSNLRRRDSELSRRESDLHRRDSNLRRRERGFSRRDTEPRAAPSASWRTNSFGRQRGHSGDEGDEEGLPEKERIVIDEVVEESDGGMPSRPSRPIRMGYESSDSDSDSSSTTESSTGTQEFSLSRYQDRLSADKIFSSARHLDPEHAERPHSPSRSGLVDLGKTYHVFHSSYKGEGEVGGTHKAELSVLQESTKVPSLFRWHHFEDHDMVLKQFFDRALNLPTLNDSEKSGINRLMIRVRKHDNSRQGSMEPRHLQVNITLANTDPHVKNVRQQAITWMCIPYFYLGASATNQSVKQGAHPMRTLLQRGSSTAHSKRDSQQAVRSIPSIPNNFIFHVAQVWMLVVGDSLLMTCGRIKSSEYERDIIHVSRVPDPPLAEREKILIRYEGAVVWSFHVNRVVTWLDVKLQFLEFWGCEVKLFYRGHPVTPELWPYIVQRAKNPADQIWLDLKLRKVNSVEARSVENQDVKDKASTERHEGLVAETSPNDHVHAQNDGKREAETKQQQVANDEHEPPRDFHVLAWCNYQFSKTSGRNVTLDREQFQLDLKDMDHFLRQKKAYRQCPISIYEAVAATVRNANEEIDQSGDEAKLSDQSAIFMMCEALFRFFMPLDTSEAVVVKFWGAVQSVITLSKTSATDARSAADAQSLLSELWQVLARRVQPFRDLMSQVPPEHHHRVKMPNELITAWVHLVLALAECAAQSETWEKELSTVQKHMKHGIQEVVRNFEQTTLLNKAVLMPMDIASCLCIWLIKDVCGRYDNIHDCYKEYLEMLDVEMNDHASERRYQARLSQFQDEVSAIQGVIQQQRNILIESDNSNRRKSPVFASSKGERLTVGEKVTVGKKTLAQTYATIARQYNDGDIDLQLDRGDNSIEIKPTDPEGYRGLLINDGLQLLASRKENFEEMDRRAKELKALNQTNIETNKDGQERAIYAFTIVTIIFLPLSTVAGILGMNTNDIRNMTTDQWVYWAIALPLTVVIVVICLLISNGLSRKFRVPSDSVVVWRTTRKQRGSYSSTSS